MLWWCWMQLARAAALTGLWFDRAITRRVVGPRTAAALRSQFAARREAIDARFAARLVRFRADGSLWWKAWKRAPRRRSSIVGVTIGAPSMYEAPEPGRWAVDDDPHLGAWKGTAHDPYDAPSEHERAREWER